MCNLCFGGFVDGAFNQEIVVKTIDKRVKDPPSPKTNATKSLKNVKLLQKKVRKKISTVGFRTEKCPDKKINFFLQICSMHTHNINKLYTSKNLYTLGPIFHFCHFFKYDFEIQKR